MSEIEKVKTDVQAAAVKVDTAKRAALKVVNAEEGWIARHPGLIGWICLALFVLCIVLATKGCA